MIGRASLLRISTASDAGGEKDTSLAAKEKRETMTHAIGESMVKGRCQSFTGILKLGAVGRVPLLQEKIGSEIRREL